MIQKLGSAPARPAPPDDIDCPVHGRITPVLLHYKDQHQEIKWPMCGLCYHEAVKAMVLQYQADFAEVDEADGE